MRQTDRIPFNRPTFIGPETDRIAEALARQKIGPGGPYARACQAWLTDRFDTVLAVPTGSCTAALEIAAILLDLAPGDEVILPSFGYPSTANAFVRVGAVPVFADIDPDSMNLDPAAVEAAITPRTRAIVPIHYGGQPADMDRLGALAAAHGLSILEDAANGFLSDYRGRMCGTIGRLGCVSFHETKYVHCGQGGALLVNDPALAKRAEVVLEKGTDRHRFLRGEVDRYSWQDIGSSYALDDIRAAFLSVQLDHSAGILRTRRAIWDSYHRALTPLAEQGRIVLPPVPDPAVARGNGMIFWLKAATEDQRTRLIAHLDRAGVHATFHYVPLHSAPAGQRYGRFSGEDRHSSAGAGRLLRLPIYHDLREADRVAAAVVDFFDRDPVR